MWLLPYFLKGVAKSSYQVCLNSTEDARINRNTKDHKNTPYPNVVYYLLSTYGTTDVINETDDSVFAYSRAASVSMNTLITWPDVR